MRIIKRPRTNKRTNKRANKRAIKRSIKTRRQTTGGYIFGWSSFITADKNPVDGTTTPGIDVKVKLHNNQPQWWLIGGIDNTFQELLILAKGGRYYNFIKKLQETYPNFDSFTNPGEFTYTSKGIKLSPHQFCKLFITNPYILDYPELRNKFTGRGFKCPTDQEEELLPTRQDNRISDLERNEKMAMEMAIKVERLRNQREQNDELMGKLDQVYKGVSGLSGLHQRQDQRQSNQREQTDKHSELMGNLDQALNLVSRLPQHQYQRQDQRQDGVSGYKGDEVN